VVKIFALCNAARKDGTRRGGKSIKTEGIHVQFKKQSRDPHFDVLGGCREKKGRFNFVFIQSQPEVLRGELGETQDLF